MKKGWIGAIAAVMTLSVGTAGVLAAGNGGNGLGMAQKAEYNCRMQSCSVDLTDDRTYGNQNNGQGAGFVDEDGDGVCDNRGTGLGNGQGAGFVDEDGDGICDNLGQRPMDGTGYQRGHQGGKNS